MPVNASPSAGYTWDLTPDDLYQPGGYWLQFAFQSSCMNGASELINPWPVGSTIPSFSLNGNGSGVLSMTSKLNIEPTTWALSTTYTGGSAAASTASKNLTASAQTEASPQSGSKSSIQSVPMTRSGLISAGASARSGIETSTQSASMTSPGQNSATGNHIESSTSASAEMTTLIAVSVTFGTVLMLTVAYFIVLKRRGRKSEGAALQAKTEETNEPATATTLAPIYDGWGPRELSGEGVHHELPADREVYELPGSVMGQELAGTGGENELPTSWTGPELDWLLTLRPARRRGSVRALSQDASVPTQDTRSDRGSVEDTVCPPHSIHR